MRVHKINIAFVRCAPEAMEDYNRWYDMDHLPEFVSLPHNLMGRRYVATPDCQELRGSRDLDGLRDDAGNMCTVYFSARDMSQGDSSARTALGERLRGEGRMFQGPREILLSQEFTVVKGYTRAGFSLAPEAIPYIGHRGIYVVIGEVIDPDRRSEWEAYYDEIHIPDILAAHGIAAMLRLTAASPPSAQGESRERFMLMSFLDEEPVEVIRGLRGRIDGWREKGRLMPPGAYQLLFQSPYRSITPLEYGFVEAFRSA